MMMMMTMQYYYTLLSCQSECIIQSKFGIKQSSDSYLWS